MRNDILKLEHNGDAQAKVLKVFSLAVKVLTFWKKLFNGAIGRLTIGRGFQVFKLGVRHVDMSLDGRGGQASFPKTISTVGTCESFHQSFFHYFR
ncbi:hypothetical protein BLX87_15760 [Bacillus sp. VT-16-64]|nr:hypothetical protein BLX87_15760 [Bacillus sp. VT-16-64]